MSKPTQGAWLATLVITSIATCSTQSSAYNPLNREEYLAKIKQAEALYKDKCEKVAGISIYKTVPDVEGVLLMKVRPERSDRELADPNWPGAAFGGEFYGDSYIRTFLGYEYRGVDKNGVMSSVRGYINTDKRPEGLPGYRWVEVIDEKDGRRHRITGSQKVVGKKDTTAKGVQMAMEKDPNYDLNIYRWSLDKSVSNSPSPRYGVTYEDHVIPEDRYLGVASSTVKVIDLQTNEVLGEMIRYAWSPGAPSRVNPSPWLTAYRCPDHARGTSEATRKFVDQILIPAKEK